MEESNMSDVTASPKVTTSADNDIPAEQSAITPSTHPQTSRPRHAVAGEHSHTRIGAAWAAVFLSVVLGVALIDFIVENTRSVRVDFFSASGHIPVAVALLVATLAGAAVVLTVGVCRTTQLRLMIRRRRRQASHAPPATTTHDELASTQENDLAVGAAQR